MNSNSNVGNASNHPQHLYDAIRNHKIEYGSSVSRIVEALAKPLKIHGYMLLFLCICLPLSVLMLLWLLSNSSITELIPWIFPFVGWSCLSFLVVDSSYNRKRKTIYKAMFGEYASQLSGYSINFEKYINDMQFMNKSIQTDEFRPYPQNTWAYLDVKVSPAKLEILRQITSVDCDLCNLLKDKIDEISKNDMVVKNIDYLLLNIDDLYTYLHKHGLLNTD